MFPMKQRYVNLRGRNVYSCEPCPHFPKQSTKKDKFEGYGVSFESEQKDKKEKEPMNKLQETLAKVKLK